MTPEEVVALLNPYLEAMTGAVYKHGGTIDKYEGDAVIAFFGEPVRMPIMPCVPCGPPSKCRSPSHS